MRIVGGRHRGRHLLAPEGLAVRPTADRTREALFNILTQGRLAPGRDQGPEAGPALAGARVLDAFAGTGALGLEALSRGAREVVFMENQAAALAALEANLDALGERAAAVILRCDVLHPPPAVLASGRGGGACQFALLDPPYGQGLAAPALAALAAAGWLAPGALVSVELMKDESFTAPEGFEPADERRYGKARLVILRAVSCAPAVGSKG
jgi:16S rRNA (guanine966-N2)-methyltransferase